jgi:hypothetical protein
MIFRKNSEGLEPLIGLRRPGSLCDLVGWSGAATTFPRSTLASTSLPPLSLSSSLLPSSEVAPSTSSSAFSSTLRFSSTSGGCAPHGPFVSGVTVLDKSAFLLYGNRIEVPSKCSSELAIVGFLRYRCVRARNEVGPLSGNNVECGGSGSSRPQAGVLENLVDVGSLCMVVRCPLVSHHLNKEIADCRGGLDQPSATRSSQALRCRTLTMYVTAGWGRARTHTIPGLLLRVPTKLSKVWGVIGLMTINGNIVEGYPKGEIACRRCRSPLP